CARVRHEYSNYLDYW
nr:immunoglobulin heavy chain junction region [Macaca mulatta]MOV86877.1 immunoglobulin heavy chain junction region [Macaca mulatta]MOV87284.1 immunoglobulin heavy chain junction region [Macaca mulatta]MOV87334.1 immunoglobulin heavy chain junction region [Macaca mulatta]MOV87548.1 immunoglobulin heavy chain junction region [Macaca mulatta]